MSSRFFRDYDGYKITYPYGMRTILGSTGFHQGVDLVAVAENGGAISDWILAFDSGVVTDADYNSVSGYYCRIRHDDTAETLYCHFLKDTLRVKKGDHVERGDVLGYMGNTGRSTGAHLHFGISLYGKYVDPEPYFEKSLNNVNNITLTHNRKVLKQGAQGEEVRLLQTLLNFHGAKLVSDGSFGPATDKALRAFQDERNLASDGSAGPATWGELMKFKNIY